MNLLPPGTSVIQVTATDADDATYGNSAKVVYSILEGQPYFSVDPETGQCRVKLKLLWIPASILLLALSNKPRQCDVTAKKKTLIKSALSVIESLKQAEKSARWNISTCFYEISLSQEFSTTLFKSQSVTLYSWTMGKLSIWSNFCQYPTAKNLIFLREVETSATPVTIFKPVSNGNQLLSKTFLKWLSVFWRNNHYFTWIK